MATGVGVRIGELSIVGNIVFTQSLVRWVLRSMPGLQEACRSSHLVVFKYLGLLSSVAVSQLC